MTAGHQQAGSVTAVTSKQYPVTVPAGTKVVRFATKIVFIAPPHYRVSEAPGTRARGLRAVLGPARVRCG